MITTWINIVRIGTITLYRTNSYGGETQISINSTLGVSSIGLEFSKDEINSTNLGIHDRNKGGIFAEQYFQPADNISVSAGFFAYNYSSIGWKFWPGIDAVFKPSEKLRFFASAGQAFRIPNIYGTVLCQSGKSRQSKFTF